MAGKRRARREFGKVVKKGNRHYVEYTGPDGRKHTPGKSFGTKTDAEGWLSTERRLIDQDNWISPEERRKKAAEVGKTVGQWVTEYYEHPTYTKRWKLTTANKYREHVTNRLTGDHLLGTAVAKLKDTQLTELKRADIVSWWDAVEGQFANYPSQNYAAWVRLRQALNEAVHRELIPHSPGEGVRISRPRSAEKYLPTDSEIFNLIDAVPLRYKMLAILTLAHGLRIGEALGLERKHIIVEPMPAPLLPKITICVRQDAEYTEGEKGNMFHLFGPTKTPAGNRDVPVLGRFVLDVLHHMAVFAAREPITVITESGPRRAILVNMTSRGKLVAPTQFQEDIREARKALGISGKVSAHSGRNWLISKLLQQGVPARHVGRILGQEDLKTIFHYAKVHASKPRDHMDALDRML